MFVCMCTCGCMDVKQREWKRFFYFTLQLEVCKSHHLISSEVFQKKKYYIIVVILSPQLCRHTCQASPFRDLGLWFPRSSSYQGSCLTFYIKGRDCICFLEGFLFFLTVKCQGDGGGHRGKVSTNETRNKTQFRTPATRGPDFGQADIMREIHIIYFMLEGLLSSCRDWEVILVTNNPHACRSWFTRLRLPK